MKTTIKCYTCKLPKPESEFVANTKKQGMARRTKSCQGCRDKHNATFGATRIRERQQHDLTVASELNRLINWPVVTS